MNNIYEGSDILIEEMPQGCVITPIIHVSGELAHWDIAGDSITISSVEDAIELIESLERMLKVQFGVTRNE